MFMPDYVVSQLEAGLTKYHLRKKERTNKKDIAQLRSSLHI